MTSRFGVVTHRSPTYQVIRSSKKFILIKWSYPVSAVQVIRRIPAALGRTSKFIWHISEVSLTYQHSHRSISTATQFAQPQHSHSTQPLAQPSAQPVYTASRSPFFKSITPFPIISVDQEPHSYQDQQPPLHYKQVFGTETSWVWYNCWLDPSKTLLKDIYPPSANSTGPRAGKYETPLPLWSW